MWRVTARSHRLATVPAAILVALACAASAAALDLSPPLTPVAGQAGCVRDPVAAGGLCSAAVAGLLGATALAVPRRPARRLAVAAPDADAVALLRRFPSGSVAGGACVQAIGEQPCAAHAAGLHGADALWAAPDGALAVGARDDRAVVELRGTHETACISAAPIPGCTHRDRALGAVSALVGDPSGDVLYAVSFGETPGSDTVAALKRSGGHLTPVRGPGGCVRSAGPATTRCGTIVTGLEGAVAAALSPDGRSLYVAARTSSAVVALRRDRTTGALSPVGCVADPGRTPSCGKQNPALKGADAVTVSPDGRTVYVAAADPGAVLALRRNRDTGALVGVVGCIAVLPEPGCGQVPAIRGARALLVSPNGAELDIAADAGDAIVTVGLRPGAGTITDVRTSAPATAAVNAPTALVSDGLHLYAASAYDDAVLALNRTPPPGR
jgi:DNA-binding beta-propeller fold protein YncE